MDIKNYIKEQVSKSNGLIVGYTPASSAANQYLRSLVADFESAGVKKIYSSLWSSQHAPLFKDFFKHPTTEKFQTILEYYRGYVDEHMVYFLADIQKSSIEIIPIGNDSTYSSQDDANEMAQEIETKLAELTDIDVDAALKKISSKANEDKQGTTYVTNLISKNFQKVNSREPFLLLTSCLQGSDKTYGFERGLRGEKFLPLNGLLKLAVLDIRTHDNRKNKEIATSNASIDQEQNYMRISLPASQNDMAEQTPHKHGFDYPVKRIKKALTELRF